MTLCGVAAAALSAPASAADTELGPFFERLSSAPARTAPVRATVTPPARPVYRAAHTGTRLDTATLERMVFTHINLYRMSRGLRPLGAHNDLAAVARSHANGVVAGTERFNHDGMRSRLMPFMGGFGSRAGGEILAYNRGAGDPARTALMSWINSPTHKDVMESDYTRMGVGVAVAPDGRHYFTVLFLR